MRKIISKTMIFMGIFSLVLGTVQGFGTNIIFADDIELIGSELGLVVEPTDTRLFELENLNPGDTREATITIKNENTSPFQLYMRAERIGEAEEIDLFDRIELQVFLGDRIYSGNIKGFALENIDLGRFNPEDTRNLRFVITLPGPETGNEYQATSAEIKWIFTAEADVPPPPPPPPPPPGGTTTVTVVTPPTPPVEEIIIDEEVPEAPVEEIIEEEIPEEPEEIIIDEEIPEAPVEIIIEEEIPQAPVMPRTGEIPTLLYYLIGSILIGLGIIGIRKTQY